MADTVISLNSKVLCWDEAAETDLPADKTILFWWRQNVPESLKLALQKKYQVVICPRLPLYFDFVQDAAHTSGRKWNGRFNSLTEIYNFPDKQIPVDELLAKQVLGIQANLWTEVIGSEKRLDYMSFPRMAALAEAAWTDFVVKDEASFDEHLKEDFRLYDKAGIYYFNPFNRSAHPEVIDFALPVIKFHVRAGKNKHRKKMKNYGHNSKRKHKSGTLKKHHLADKRKR